MLCVQVINILILILLFDKTSNDRKISDKCRNKAYTLCDKNKKDIIYINFEDDEKVISNVTNNSLYEYDNIKSKMIYVIGYIETNFKNIKF